MGISANVLHGTLPALLTPYNDDKSINEDEFIKICEFGISKGLNGLFCNGSSGDSQSLDLHSQIKLMKLSKIAAKNNVPIITGITSCVYENTFILAQNAHEIGLDALLLAMPYYYKFDENTLFEYVKNIAKNVKLPLYIYNIPLFAPQMNLSLIEKLSKIDNIIGIKDSSGDALLLNHILDVVPEHFDVFVGREEFYAGALFAGARGSMTSMGAILPEFMSAIYTAMGGKNSCKSSQNHGDSKSQNTAEKNYEKALKIQKSILKAIRFGMSLPFPMGFALLLKARGFRFGNATPHPLSKDTSEKLETKFAEAKGIIRDLESINLV